MPKYRITDPQTGRVVTISGERPPTQGEAAGIFDKVRGGAGPGTTFGLPQNVLDANSPRGRSPLASDTPFEDQVVGAGRALGRSVANLPRAVTATAQATNPFQLLGADVPQAPAAEEVFPALAPQEGEELGDIIGTVLPYILGGEALAGTKLGRLAGPAVSDYVLTTGETGSPQAGQVAAAAGMIPDLLRRGLGKFGKYRVRKGVEGLVQPKSVGEGRALLETTDEISRSGARDRKGVADFSRKRALSEVDRLKRREAAIKRQGGLDTDAIEPQLQNLEEADNLADYLVTDQPNPDFRVDMSRLSMDEARQVGRIRGASRRRGGSGQRVSDDEAIAQLAAEDKDFARRIGATREEMSRRPLASSPSSSSAQQVQNFREDLQAKVMKYAQDQGIPPSQVDELFSTASAEELLKLRNTYARENSASRAALSGVDIDDASAATDAVVRNDIGSIVESHIMEGLPRPGAKKGSQAYVQRTLSSIEDSIARWVAVLHATERAGLPGGTGVREALGATSSSFLAQRGQWLQAISNPALISATAEVLQSPFWPAASVKWGRKLADAVASGSVQRITNIGARIGVGAGVRKVDRAIEAGPGFGDTTPESLSSAYLTLTEGER